MISLDMKFKRNSILLAICVMQIGSVALQPADLGTFGSHNDLQNGISAYSLPPEERMPSEIYVLAYINYTYVNKDGKEIHFAEEKAKYGEGRIRNVYGKVIHITSEYDLNDHTACTDRIRGTNGHQLPVSGTPWIALIRRGNCNFEEKVKHVYMYRAIGVIIYNDRDAQSLDKMKILDKDRNITAVFTYKSIGEEIAKIVDSNYELNASISEGRYAKPIPNINRTSVLFVSISFIVLMIISFVWLVFYYVQRFRYLQTKDRKSRQLCTVAKRVIAKIPTKSIKSEDNNDNENDCCAICIEPYKITDVIRVLPCRHEFHKSCIDPWLLEHRTCPMCKMDILKHYGFVVGAQNQIINLNSFIITAQTSNPTTLNIIPLNIPITSQSSQQVSSPAIQSSPSSSSSPISTTTTVTSLNTSLSSLPLSTTTTTTSTISSSTITSPFSNNSNFNLNNNSNPSNTNCSNNNHNNFTNLSNNNATINSLQIVQDVNNTNFSSNLNNNTESRQVTEV